MPATSRQPLSGAAIRVEVIDDLVALAALGPAWNAVYGADPEAQICLSHMWILAWLRVHRTPWIVLAARAAQAGGDYVAFLPLRLRTWFEPGRGFRSRLILSGDQFTDYNGLICRPEWEAIAAPLLSQAMVSAVRAPELRLDNLRVSDRRRRLLLSAFDDLKFRRRRIPGAVDETGIDNDVCPYVDLPSDFDSYLATLSANTRQKLRRLLRRLEGEGEYAVTVDPSNHEADIAALLDLWRSKWGTEKGERADTIVGANLAMLTHCAREGRLFLPVLRKGDRMVAALAILVDQEKRSFHYLIGGCAEGVAAFSPGLLLHAFAIRSAISQGVRTYDFMRGDEAYKSLFAPKGTASRIQTLQIVRRGAAQGHDPRTLPVMLEELGRLAEHAAPVDLERACRAILELDAQNALAFYLLGRSLAAQGQLTAASAALRRSLVFAPEGDNAWALLAGVLEASGALPAALAAAREALRLKPADPSRRVEVTRLEDRGRPAVQFPSRELLDDIEAVARKLSCDIAVTFDPGPRVDLSRG